MNTFNINKIKPAEIKTIGHYTGYVSIVLGLFMIIPIICAYIYNDPDIYLHSFIISAVINITVGVLLYFIFNTKSITNLSLKGSLIFVMSIWGFASIFASLPYFISGDLSFVDAFFEGMSGITTTGFSMYDVYTFPYSISIWRCLIQWFGGLGIIFLLLVIVPSSVSLKRLYFAEGKTEQMTPNIKHTATIFIKVYLILTALAISLYLLAGLDLFDSICYSFVGIATGGYSIHPEHINNFTNPIIQAITIIVMLMGGTNFIVHYRIMKGNWRKLHKDVEIRAMFAIIVLATIVIAISLYINGLYGQNVVLIFRHSLFQVVSILTSTGFLSTDINIWTPFSYYVLVLLMFTGGAVCSTAGGIKIYNILVMFKAIWWETQQMFLPTNTVIKRKIYHDQRKREISKDAIRTILVYIIAYMLLFIVSTLIVLMFSKNLEISTTVVAASIGNTGVAPSYISPSNPLIVKIVLIIDFWAGRIGVWPLLLSIVYLVYMFQSKMENKNE
ncbi:MAG: hypothetical protein BZ133_01460 [Methanosphaera sp. SHI613]|nr:MAG: hypothetical protein BZ133_01460 [Methanosphaera sp. SHI613]